MNHSDNNFTCTNQADLSALLTQSPALVVEVHALALASMGSRALRHALDELNEDVRTVVVPPELLGGFGLGTVRVGEFLVFSNGRLLGRLDRASGDPVARVLGILQTSAASRPGVDGHPAWFAEEQQGQRQEDVATVVGVFAARVNRPLPTRTK